MGVPDHGHAYAPWAVFQISLLILIAILAQIAILIMDILLKLNSVLKMDDTNNDG